jgi:tungstate transport system ATP-binding protein
MKIDSIIELRNIKLQRGNSLVLNIDSLPVATGKILALIGPNGAGKSSLLLVLAGLLKPGQGELFFEGKQIRSNAERLQLRRCASVVFQEPLLLDNSVYENVALGLKLRGNNRAEIAAKVQEMLQYFGISNLAKRSARKLSGGEAKRVSLARAFVLDPRIVLLDEPFNSLDPPTREAIIDDLQNILAKTKITAVLALHDREETLRLAQDVAVMNGGKIIQTGTTAQIFNRPAHEFIADFVGTESILEGNVVSNDDSLITISVGDKMIEAVGNFKPLQKVYCCLRPENITISNATQRNISARNLFEGKVQKIIHQGFYYKLTLDCGFLLVVYITHPSYEDLHLGEGARIFASFKATAVHIIPREA